MCASTNELNRRAFLAAAPMVAAGAQMAFPPDLLRKRLPELKTQALLIRRGGQTVFEWYADGRNPGMTHYMASATKAIVGGTSLLVAAADGRIRPWDLASKYIPEWREHPQKRKITIRHLATHTSGIEDSSVPGIAHPNEPGWKGQFWKRDPDPFSISRDAPLLFEPGQGYQYSNPGVAMLAWCVTASLKGAPHSDIRTLLHERVMKPLGIGDNEWQIGYGRAYEVDGLQLWANWGGANFTPRATARIAEWMMRRGEGLIPARFVDQAVKYSGMPLPKRSDQEPYAPGSGLAWYTNFDGVWPEVPRDAYAAAGAGQQIVLVVPSLDLVVVRNGAEMPGGSFWGGAYKEIFVPVMASMGYPARPAPVPYPKSTVIKGVEFAPASSIRRAAIECDNWPITWADDDQLYTSYGDGSGFEPRIPQKLGLGFARVEGLPNAFHGVNIRSATGERIGDGPNSAKASGMLAVDGVLYILARNTGNAQLAWSEDKARTWRWGWKFEKGFGSPAFLNYGKDYAGARDNFVYVYSQQGASAYAMDDGVVLARCPKQRMRERGAWEFHAASGWSNDIAAAEPVFRYPKHCQRVDAVYHAATKRFLLIVSYGHNGGWGIYDAPEPAGPWTTVFHTEYWGLGETHGYRLPSKWISADGRSAALVFSGLIYDGVSYDAFCVRSMQFIY